MGKAANRRKNGGPVCLGLKAPWTKKYGGSLITVFSPNDEDQAHFTTIARMFFAISWDDVMNARFNADTLQALGVSIFDLRMAVKDFADGNSLDLLTWAWERNANQSLLWLTELAFNTGNEQKSPFLGILPQMLERYQTSSEEFKFLVELFKLAAKRVAKGKTPSMVETQFKHLLPPTAYEILTYEAAAELSAVEQRALASEVPNTEPLGKRQQRAQPAKRL